MGFESISTLLNRLLDYTSFSRRQVSTWLTKNLSRRSVESVSLIEKILQEGTVSLGVLFWLTLMSCSCYFCSWEFFDSKFFLGEDVLLLNSDAAFTEQRRSRR